jgi:hypothetical protein
MQCLVIRLRTVYLCLCSVTLLYIVYTVLLCYNLFPGRPDKAGPEIDKNVVGDREHVGSLSLTHWSSDKQVKMYRTRSV